MSSHMDTRQVHVPTNDEPNDSNNQHNPIQDGPLQEIESKHDVEPEPEYLHGTKLYLLLLALVLAIMIMALDIAVVSTALPRITDTFNTITDIGWYGAAYSFTNSALQPFSGKIFTFFPTKISFIAFLAVFELGSILCAASTSSAMFIIGRAVAGLGASGLINGALIITNSAGPPEKKPMFMGIIMAIAGVGQLLGPLIGGSITARTSWRWCFWINLPAGAITILFLVLITFPKDDLRKTTPNFRAVIRDFDLVGFALFCPAIIMLMMALQWGGVTHPWSSPLIIVLLVVSFTLLIPLGWWEHRAGNNAMFPAPLLRRRVIYSACITGFLAGATTLVITYYLPLWFQTVKSADPLQSAIDTLPSFISQLLFAIIFGILCPRVVPYLTPFGIIGSSLGALGTGLMSTFALSTSTANWIGYQILAGTGRGLLMQIPVQVVQQHVTVRSDLPVATAVVTFFTFFGGSIFLAFAQTVFGNLMASALPRYAPNVDAVTVLKTAGATDILSVVSLGDVEGVKKAYNSAITRTLYLGVGASCVGVVSALGMGWKRVEGKKAKSQEEKKDEEKQDKEEGIEEVQVDSVAASTVAGNESESVGRSRTGSVHAATGTDIDRQNREVP